MILAWLIGKVFWSVFYAPSSYLQQPIFKPVQVSTASPLTNTNLYLFGKNDSLPAAKKTTPVTALKASKLNLRLLGVVVAPTMSVAIIEKSGKANSYALGEQVQKAVTLQEVHADYVIINNRGLLERVEMSKSQNLFNDSNESVNQLTSQQSEKLAQVKSNALRNPVSIMRYVRFQNIMNNGKIQAVRVWPRQEKEIFSALGFKAGDQLISVDGNSIDQLSKSPELWQSLLKQSQFELTVKRKGLQIPLSIEL